MVKEMDFPWLGQGVQSHPLVRSRIDMYLTFHHKHYDDAFGEEMNVCINNVMIGVRETERDSTSDENSLVVSKGIAFEDFSLRGAEWINGSSVETSCL
ncbi:hypothetical protein Mp_1g08800 [Marchantia polymorpha subsp. ruderalis]|uniref:Uncharacterized protein n=2 Tax=Marchantia polymorpha TaxID=3197 RepID=A0AAF6AN26_MARPO|nr:hypothetical protein MARPO_0036s0121 [Marchantia polymorpha]BBM97846.1 hypothetical protein Mp_1g08800 [Marchantia polymorpha subsp. ruderalis]|eukprot:PTQ41147.1 hypothetical protein MARPO_0036s0121 [Marchantia polymorpha]